jgi:hypothetical protein
MWRGVIKIIVELTARGSLWRQAGQDLIDVITENFT